MTQTYTTPQEAEDAFYDALEDADLERLMTVWAENDEVCCLLPMAPLVQGHAAVRDVFARVFSGGKGVSLNISHLCWIEAGDIAIHQVEEAVQGAPPNAPSPPPFYGTNIFLRNDSGWRLLIHQNAPTPPPVPPGMVMPE
jgi:ketosteroid isomerase-like protein